MSEAPKVVPFSTPEMIELRQLQKERVEEQERMKKLREKREREWEQRERPRREGRMKVAEWCFLNFKFFEPSTRERDLELLFIKAKLGGQPSGKPIGLMRLRNFITSDGYANAETCRWLASLHRRIAKHSPSPFTREELIEWELLQMPEERLGLIVTPSEPPQPPQPPKPFKRRM
jgi:hypothetical protein